MYTIQTRPVLSMMLGLLICLVTTTVYAQGGIQHNPDYIGGPWIYTVVSCGRIDCEDIGSLKIDFLSRYTDERVAENSLAQGEIKPIDILFVGGHLRWHGGFLGGRHEIFTENIGDLVGGVGLNPEGFSNAVFYGLIAFNVDKASQVTMHLGYSDYAKVWLNGKVVYTSRERMQSNEASEMPQRPSVPLRAGKNLLMVKVIEGIGWNLFVNFETNFRVSYRIKDGKIVFDDILSVDPSASTVSTRWASLKNR